MIFLSRIDAGRRLAAKLEGYVGRKDVIVLGIPRGGVPVAFEVSTALEVPLDVFVVRKLGVPSQPELAFGAIASGGVRVVDPEIVESIGISRLEIDRIAAREKAELQRREQVYRKGRDLLDLDGKVVILVDDGIATGATTRAAIQALRQLNPARIVLAAPVAPASTYHRLLSEVEDFVCLETPKTFFAIGQFYEDFTQVSDQEVTKLLRRSSEDATRQIAGARRKIQTGVHP
jgi:putative phosphoribosyl transferase